MILKNKKIKKKEGNSKTLANKHIVEQIYIHEKLLGGIKK